MEKENRRFEFLGTNLTSIKFNKIVIENDLEYSGKFHSEISEDDPTDIRVVGNVRMRDIHTEETFIEVQMEGYYKLYNIDETESFDLNWSCGNDMINIIFADISSLISDITRRAYPKPIVLPNEVSESMLNKMKN